MKEIIHSSLMRVLGVEAIQLSELLRLLQLCGSQWQSSRSDFINYLLTFSKKIANCSCPISS